MTDAISNFVLSVFGNNIWLGVMFLAFIPVTELKAAIPFALSAEIWGAGNALNIYQAFLFSYLGSIIPAFLVIFLLTPVFNWMKKFKFLRKIVNFFEERFKKLGEKINKKTKDADSAESVELSEEEMALQAKLHRKRVNWIKFWGVLAFVAIPLPLTGVWTGSAIAVFIGLDFKYAIPAVLIGNFIAGIFISLVCVVFGSYLIVFYIILGIFVLVLIVSITMALVKKARKKTA